MSLKVELKPGERLIVGNCVITNSDQRTRLFIDGKAPILREKDILTSETANSPARRIYFAVQLMYIHEDVAKLSEDYFKLVNDIVLAAPSTIRIVDEINNEILTGQLYKALKAAKKLIQYEQELLANANSAAFAYKTVGAQTVSPRVLEANLLSSAAGKLQRCRDDWENTRHELTAALMFNRKLWTVFLGSVTAEESQLPKALRENIANLGIFVMKQTLHVLGEPEARKLTVLININREIAAGLRERA